MENSVDPYNSRFEKDYIFWMKATVVVGIATVLVGIIGIVGVLVSIKMTSDRADKAIYEAAFQTKTLTEQLRHSRYIAVANWTLELDKLYIAYPHIMKYFEEDEPITRDDPQLYALVAGVGEFMMDAMDAMLDQYNDNWPDGGWANWAEATFSKSPIFRIRLEEQRAWYCKHLYAKYVQWAKKEGKDVPKYEPCKQE